MATDAEINLKVNVGGPKGPDIERMLADIKRIGRFTTDYLKESAKGADIAEAAKIGRERAAKVGEEVAKNWEKGFADGFKNVATMGRSQQRIGLANEAVAQDVTKAEAAWRAGQLSDEKMVAILGKKREQQDSVYEAAGNLKNMVGGAEADLTNLGQMEELLAKHEKFSEAMRGEASGARALANELRNSAGALEDEAEALDLSIPGNEKRKLQLLQQAKDDRARANAAEKSAEVIETETAAINKNIAAVDGSSKAYEKANKEVDRSTAKALDQKKKLVEIGAKQALSDQKQVVQEQQIAERQERRAAAEEKRAKQEEALREKEIFQSELIGKKKLELAKIIKQLNAERSAAAKTGDVEALQKLNMQLSVARGAMRQAGMAANVNRMMLTQQASAASRLAGNLNTLATGFAGIGEAAKNGELNLTGMASSFTDLWLSVKAGIGPIGWLTMGLQVLQDIMNSHAKSALKLKEMHKMDAEAVRHRREAYGALAKAHEDVIKQQERESVTANLKAQYDQLNESLRTGLTLIEAQTNAELRRMGLTQDEAQFQRTLQKEELGRMLTEGLITRDEYKRYMVDLDTEASIAGADAAIEKQARLKEKSDKVLATRKGDLTTKMQKRKEAEYDAAQYKKTEAEVREYEKNLAVLDADAKKAEETLYNLIKDSQKGGGFNVAGALEEIAENALKYGSFGFIDWDSPDDRRQKELDKALATWERLRNQASDYKKSFRSQLGGRSTSAYLADKAEADKRLGIAKQQEEAAQNAFNAAQAENQAQKEKLNEVQEDAKLTRQRAETSKKSRLQTLDANNKAESAEKTRRQEIEKLTEDVQKKSIAELYGIKKKLEGKRGEKEGTSQWQQYNSAAESIQRTIEAREKEQADAIIRARIEAENEKKTKAFAKVNLEQVFATMQDGALSAREVELLVLQLKAARKAENETAEAIIRALAEQAANSEKTKKQTRIRIKKLQEKNSL